MGFANPKFDEWKKWRFIKKIREAETCTNAVLGYKKSLKWISFSLLFIFIKIYY